MVATHRLRVAAGIAALSGLLVSAGCSGDPADRPTARVTGQATVRPVTGADWPTYHHDNARTGVAPGFPAARSLSVAWRADLDGAVYGQPLVVGPVVFAATEHDSVYALDAGTGKVIWATHIGTPMRLRDL